MYICIHIRRTNINSIFDSGANRIEKMLFSQSLVCVVFALDKQSAVEIALVVSIYLSSVLYSLLHHPSFHYLAILKFLLDGFQIKVLRHLVSVSLPKCNFE